jgi:hypothetical protein
MDEAYYKLIKDSIRLILEADLTIGRSDEDLSPLTNEQIEEFIELNDNLIELVIANIYREYEDDNELHLLKDGDLSRFREYLYENINTDIPEDEDE